MAIKVDRSRARLAIGLFSAAVVAFGIAWVTWDADTQGCDQERSETAILGCVAEQGAGLEPEGVTLAALILGAVALGGAAVVAARSTRRVVTIPEAANALGLKPGEVRRLVDEGTLDVRDREPGAIYLDPEQVRRAGAGGPSSDR